MTVEARRPPDTVEDALARRIPTPESMGSARAAALRELGAVDRAVCDAVARTPTAALDGPVRRLSTAADHSRLWLIIAAAIALPGGWRGRRAALEGVISIGITSATVNLGAKSLHRRRRPHRAAVLPAARQVPMPASTSFPSGHAASAFAFSYAVGRHLPGLAVPVRLLVTGVAYSRVHTGVHYPGDVVIGSVTGAGHDRHPAHRRGRVTRLDVADGFDVRVRPTLRAEVTMSRLEELRAAGASTVTVASKVPDSGLRLLVSGSSRVAADLALDRAGATVSGSSHLDLTGTANALSAQGSGASRLELADLHLQHLDITLSGASHAASRSTRRSPPRSRAPPT